MWTSFVQVFRMLRYRTISLLFIKTRSCFNMTTLRAQSQLLKYKLFPVQCERTQSHTSGWNSVRQLWVRQNWWSLKAYYLTDTAESKSQRFKPYVCACVCCIWFGGFLVSFLHSIIVLTFFFSICVLELLFPSSSHVLKLCFFAPPCQIQPFNHHVSHQPPLPVIASHFHTSSALWRLLFVPD